MSPPPGERQPNAASTVNDDRVSAIRSNARSAIAAFEAIGTLARAEDGALDAVPPAAPRDPAQEHARLARTLCALRHLADEFGQLSFGDVLRAANDRYALAGGDYSRAATGPRARIAAELISICEAGITAPTQHRGGFWPSDTLASLHGYAGRRGLDFNAAVTRLTTRLITDLRHYANHQGIDFQAALASGFRAHASQQLRAGGPFETGQPPGRLSPAPGYALPGAVSFRMVPTNQGVVVSPADAEWLLTRTAARNREREQHGYPASPRDTDDQRVLAAALAEATGLSPAEILGGLAPQIADRVQQIEGGPQAAAELGREHGRTGAPPYCDLGIDGDATALFHALGETEWMTDANHSYRVALVIAYAEAYRQAAGPGPSPADSPARIAARDFPATSPAATPADSSRPARGAGQAPRHGPRPGTQ